MLISPTQSQPISFYLCNLLPLRHSNIYVFLHILFLFHIYVFVLFFFFFSSRRRHTRSLCDWSSDVCSSDLMTFSPSNCGSCVSTVRLKGAYFSRAMRSQVSSTASKVSREWSAKRSRSPSASARSHS